MEPCGEDSDIKVLVVDDERLARDLMVSLVQKDGDLTLLGTCSDGKQARLQIPELRPDLLFLDIQMPGIDGVELAHSALRSDYHPHFVFVTAFDQYAVKAFEMDALDYLLKPVDPDRFRVTTGRAKRAIQRVRMSALGRQMARLADRFEGSPTPVSKILHLSEGNELIQISIDDIVWVEAASQYVHIHTSRGSHTLCRPLKSLQSELPGELFVRVHRSALVNRRRLKRVLRRPNGVHALILDDGTAVSLSRSRRSMVRQLLKQCETS